MSSPVFRIGRCYADRRREEFAIGSSNRTSGPTMKITAAIVPARSRPFEIITADLAGPLPDEVLVRIVASGMCHNDLHARGRCFPELPSPVVCGHEGAGIVEEIGSAVSDLAVGDRVVISFPWCGDCE